MPNRLLQFEVAEDKLHPGDWRVEAINIEGDGEVYTAIFVGPDAKERADEYAEWKNAKERERETPRVVGGA